MYILYTTDEKFTRFIYKIKEPLKCLDQLVLPEPLYLTQNYIRKIVLYKGIKLVFQ